MPVRLSLPAFDPGDDAGQVAADVLAQRLDAWIAQQLHDVYVAAAPIAQSLIGEGRVLPILDGLDEMDPDHSAPVRAIAVVRALEPPSRDRTSPSRPGLPGACYRQLTSERSEPWVGSPCCRMPTTVQIEPLAVEQVADYLCLPVPLIPSNLRWHRGPLASRRSLTSGLGRRARWP